MLFSANLLLRDARLIKLHCTLMAPSICRLSKTLHNSNKVGKNASREFWAKNVPTPGRHHLKACIVIVGTEPLLRTHHGNNCHDLVTTPMYSKTSKASKVSKANTMVRHGPNFYWEQYSEGSTSSQQKLAASLTGLAP